MKSKAAEIVGMLDSIVVFRGVSRGAVLESLRCLLTSLPTDERVRLYSDFVHELFMHDYDFGHYLLGAVCLDENEYITLRAKGEQIPAPLSACVTEELKIFSELSKLTSRELAEFTGYGGYLPMFDSTAYDFAAEYEKRASNAERLGCGIFAENVMFRLHEGEIVPLKSPDPVTLSHLIAYERERGRLLDNVRAFLDGRPALNMLLYGDAGTGKSSTVKAAANQFAPDGLRLIEIKKEQIRELPHLMERLRESPLKFMIYIDDLSFGTGDDNFSSLKAILEGSASVQPKNTLICVTSNRRHLVKESFSDREGDEVHRNDTMQEQISMSERFGLVILFAKPSKSTYLEIVHGLLDEAGIDKADDTDVDACAFALRKGGFTPRAAEQYVRLCMARQ
ncbi:MAG: ATP-binding protein [Clostridia bacterium]|nr:ATP-binding protein [Clostridia bacterium]